MKKPRSTLRALRLVWGIAGIRTRDPPDFRSGRSKFYREWLGLLPELHSYFFAPLSRGEVTVPLSKLQSHIFSKLYSVYCQVARMTNGKYSGGN